MKYRILSLLFICISSAVALHAGHGDTLFVSDYGIHPYSYENQTIRMRKLLDDCKKGKYRVIVFENGRYDLWPEGAVRKEYFISNTSSEEECPSKIKTIGLFFKEMEDVTIEGNDATLIFHGKMTMMAMERCRNITIQGLHFDFERPGGSEATYTKVDENGVEVSFHRDSRYEIENGRIHLFGEGWRSNLNHCVEYAPESRHFFHSDGWHRLASCEASETKPGTVRFRTSADFKPKTGNTLTIRDIIRDQVGMFILESENITLKDIGVHYMHGLGIVSQYSRNITMDNVLCMPRQGSGRILASSADLMHFSGCSGKLSITGCRFEGAQDDPINIHGTNLRAIGKSGSRTLTVRFMHGQSYGFNAFTKGDTVAFVHASTMERFAYAKVIKTKRLNDRLVQLTFDSPVPEELEMERDCVENMSCTPEVEIRNCHFTRTSTRGTLVTTPRKVVITDNVYYKTGMSAILIESDAENWFESGPVRDVLIQHNTFIDCAYNGGPEHAVIAINPSNTIIGPECPVHRNIRIIGNSFVTHGNPVLYAKSVGGLVFKDNGISLLHEAGIQTMTSRPIILNGCCATEISPTDTISIADKTYGIKVGEPEHITLFKSGDCGSRYYRIPALVTTSGGTLIAVADRRNDSQADLPNLIDVVAKRSTDNGKTWSEQIVIASHTETYGYGDAALVCDRNTGDILCIFASGCGMWKSTAENPININISRSSDDGLTWSEPQCITSMLYGPDCGNPASKRISGMFAASGRALQLSDGTLMFAVAAHHTDEKWPPLHNYICISEDGGYNWELLPTPASHNGDEAKLVELYDGRWLLSIRNPEQGHRLYSISDNKGKSWSKTTVWNDLQDPACNGDIMRYTLVHNGIQHDCLVHSIPFDMKNRRNMTIALSYDNGHTWPVRRHIWNCDAGYSALTCLQDGSLGLLTEVGNWDTGFEIIFTRISPEWLLDSSL